MKETVNEIKARHYKYIKAKGDDLTIGDMRKMAAELPNKTYVLTNTLGQAEVGLVAVCVNPKKIFELKETIKEVVKQ